MTEKIVTRPFKAGDKCESEWPPKYGTGGSGSYYFDKEAGCMKEGYPPPKFKKFGEAPYVIQDTIDPYRHPATGVVVESRKALYEMDNACGTITTDKKLEPNKHRAVQLARELKEDMKKAREKAIAQIDSGTAPLTEETRTLCEQQNEIVSKALNFDAFNVAGRKDNAKGKPFRRK